MIRNSSQTSSATPVLIPALTGIRGVAALWVVAFHLSANLAGAFGTPPHLVVIGEGYLGVDVFFILSGFILCHVYNSAFSRYTIREHLHFLLVRLARIYPLHAFALLLLGAIVLTLPGFAQRFPPSFFSGSGFLVSLLLLQNWTGNPIVWNGPAWSLSAEWAAYVVFPAVLLFSRRFRSGRAAVAGAAVSLGFLAVFFASSGRSLNLPGAKAGSLRLACEFVAGSLLCRAWRLGLGDGKWWSRGNAVALAALAAILMWPVAVPLAVLPFGYFILSVVQRPDRMSRLLSGPKAIFLGEISYSLYLMHFTCIQVGDWMVGEVAGPDSRAGRQVESLLLIPAVFFVSVATYRLVERPARSIGRRLAESLAPRPRDAAPAPGGIGRAV